MADIGLRIELPEAERGLSEAEAARYGRLQDTLNRPDATPRARTSAARSLEAINRARRERMERDWQQRTEEETIALAEGRGEEIQKPATGPIRSSSRDPLVRLAQGSSLDAEQFQAAVIFRQMYELRQADSGAMDHTADRGAGHQHEAFVAKRAARAMSTQVIGIVERAIALQRQDAANGLRVFREILDRKLTMTDLGRGDAYARNVRSFRQAIDTAISAHDRWRDARPRSPIDAETGLADKA